MKTEIKRLMPLLLDVERSLDSDIKLESLAARFGASPFHFHRTFAGALGETPKKHVDRLRLERAAMLLAVTDEPVVDIALGLGFKNPETLSRNFRRFLGCSPSGYRRMAKAAQRERVAHTDFHASDEYRLSRAWFERLRPSWLLAVRHIGELTAYERDRRLACTLRGPVFTLDIDYRLEDLGGRTRLTQAVETRFNGAVLRVLMALMAPFVRKAAMQNLEASFATLERLAESSGREPARAAG